MSPGVVVRVLRRELVGDPRGRRCLAARALGSRAPRPDGRGSRALHISRSSPFAMTSGDHPPRYGSSAMAQVAGRVAAADSRRTSGSSNDAHDSLQSARSIGMVVPHPELVELCAQTQPLLRRHATALLEVSLLGFLLTGEHSNFAAHQPILLGRARKAALRWVVAPFGVDVRGSGGAATKDPAPRNSCYRPFASHRRSTTRTSW